MSDCNATKLCLIHAMKKILASQNSINVKTSGLVQSMSEQAGIRVNYITAYKALESFKQKTKRVLPNSYSYLNSLVRSMDQDLVITILQIENGHFKRFALTCPQ
ncbi:hypothetical protein CDIK_2951 [Cucumispora dikerogammari]|nr:hypothetical protein CDIK_2951 [Cucumispora dikerogammari]